MFTAVKSFVYDRRRGVTKVAGIAGAVYVVRGYVRDRLDEVKDRLEQERAARDNLKRRFQQTQDDVSYTVHALVQTLSDQILAEMDVEALTLELQNRSKARHANRLRPPSSLASSIDVVHEHDTRSDAGSGVISIASTSNAPAVSSPTGLQSWVEASGSPQRDEHEPAPSTTSSVQNDEASSIVSDSVMSASITSDSSTARTNAELWNEVKILTFTRTLTTLYATTLLSLLTSLQLTLLARAKYIHAVLQLERDERMQEHLDAQFSLSNILLSSVSGRGLEDMLAGDAAALLGEGEDAEHNVSEDVESRFLTMSWWILHVGWKDVGERVRRGVEEVFEGVSLKSKLALVDLHRLVADVRRRVEHEVTFEGTERRINFLSSLLPGTPETVQHVLTQGGFPSLSLHPYPQPPAPYDLLEFEDELLSVSVSASESFSHISHSQHLRSSIQAPAPQLNDTLTPAHHHHNDTHAQQHAHQHVHDPAFTALLEETRTVLASPDFARALEVCLDRATETLFAGLERGVFKPPAAPAVDGDGDVIRDGHGHGGEGGTGGEERARVRLAGMLPALAEWTRDVGVGVPCLLVENVLEPREVACLSAIVFARFEERVVVR